MSPVTCVDSHSPTESDKALTALENTTLFATQTFTKAVAPSLPGFHTFSCNVKGSGPDRTMYGLETREVLGSRQLHLAPFGLYASPGWNGALERSTVDGILQQLTGIRAYGFVWNVRFDHGPLARHLMAAGFESKPVATRVLQVQDTYEQTFACYSETMRNHVRRARRNGVVIRDAASDEDVCAYYKMHKCLADQKGGYKTLYPLELFLHLTKHKSAVRLILAECDGSLGAGGLFFRDGCSIIYWHGASDRSHSKMFPSCAVIDEAIRWACKTGASFVNLGGSAGIASLDQFKSLWGAQMEQNWTFAWTSGLWRRFQRLERRLRGKHAG